MNSMVKMLGTVAASLAMSGATGQTTAAAPRHAGTEPILTASLSADAAFHLQPRADRPEDLLPPAYDAFAFAEEALDGPVSPSRYAVQLYPIEKGARMNGVAPSVLQFAAPGRSGRSPARSEELSAAGKALLPEPGNWAMALAGLLGVGAIARRRMSV